MNGRFADPEMVVASKPWPEKSKLRRLRAVARTAAQGRTSLYPSAVHNPVCVVDWADRASLSRATILPPVFRAPNGDACLGRFGRDAHPVGSRAKSASTGND